MRIWSCRRSSLPATVAGLAVGALAAANLTTASARPAFADRYVGTVTGTLRAGDHTDTWTVSGITYKLFNARFARSRWGGNYKLTGGRVTFTSNGTGDCRYIETSASACCRIVASTAATPIGPTAAQPPGGGAWHPVRSRAGRSVCMRRAARGRPSSRRTPRRAFSDPPRAAAGVPPARPRPGRRGASRVRLRDRSPLGLGSSRRGRRRCRPRRCPGMPQA
jgi:hypothetical protein